MRGPVQAQREHLAQFLANGRVLPEQAQPVVVRREAAKVGPQGEAQHPGIGLVPARQIVVRRGGRGQQPRICRHPLGVVDVMQGMDAPEQGSFRSAWTSVIYVASEVLPSTRTSAARCRQASRNWTRSRSSTCSWMTRPGWICELADR